MLKQKTNKGFTIIEIIIVILIIIIFVFLVLPRIATVSESGVVKNEINRFVKYFEEKKAEVQSEKFGIIMVSPGMNSKAKNANWTMSMDEYTEQMKVPAPGRTNRNNPSKYDNMSILNYHKGCPGSPGNSPDGKWIKDSAGAFHWSDKVNMWPNKRYCISKDAIMNPGELEFNVTPSEEASFVVCSSKNTDNHNDATSKTICNYRNKLDYRYAVQVGRNLTLKIFKYDIKKDKWILQ